jgi:hypothetical protein
MVKGMALNIIRNRFSFEVWINNGGINNNNAKGPNQRHKEIDPSVLPGLDTIV